MKHLLLLSLVFSTAALFAAGPHAGPHYLGADATGIGPGGTCAMELPIAPEMLETLEGTVVSFNLEPGTYTPPLLVSVTDGGEEATIAVSTGPYYLFSESGVTPAEGDAIEILGFTCDGEEPAFVSITITIDPDGEAPQVLELRNEEGYPLWGRSGPADGGHIGLRDLVTYEGTVASVDLAPEDGCATFTLADGTVFVIPRHVLLALEVELAEGDVVTVTAFVSQRQEDHIIAVELVINGAEPVVLIDPEDRPPRPQFIRGDANSSGRVNIADTVDTLNGLFRGEGFRSACRDAYDTNDDGEVDLSDVVCGLNYMFGRNDELPAPFPGRGVDGTRDRLLCEQ